MRVVVVGAGYAGTIAANRLAKKLDDAQIIVVNPRAEFVERVRLHQQIAGSGSATTPLADMLCEGIDVHVGSVDKIGDGEVSLDDGTSLGFDHLIVAVGSTVTPLPGAVAVGTFEGAQLARARLLDLPADAVVTVIGGGPTGIETATEIAEARPDLQIRIVAATLAATLSPGAQRRVRADLEQMNIQVVEDVVREIRTAGTSFGGAVVLQSGVEVPSDLVLWAIVASVPELAARSGLQVDTHGRAVVDEHLRSVTDPRIFVVGDCAAVPGARFACATATPQGAHAAKTLIRMTKGRSIKGFSMGYAGQALSLGRRKGLLQACRRDDTPRRIFISGRIGAMSKESINRYAKYGSRTANYAWLPGPR
ncbi:FAD-dependent oxidoreductase [Tsukamurella sp. 8F]|uniref:NAD(P)/FAD-dependent oxidoreductase n=1 Tax=unclassified Tsukamurella TaxID=2633480 RepID=UPI0023B903CC|nr:MULTISPECIES: FAD-dependent oxidoreductase [unclassified Tsukamurella]MDF0528454.1 FAD-dependent oxidoreductase [Tsukamurella sp. 8J]MDF0586280.1 FAD-dependent oxidoreductase [Tsukamurella sp. 8F]